MFMLNVQEVGLHSEEICINVIAVVNLDSNQR